MWPCNCTDQARCRGIDCQILADEKISIESIVQRGKSAKDEARATAPFTSDHPRHAGTLNPQGHGPIEKDGHVAGHPRVIRIERL